MKPKNIFKVCIYGAESTGKTTLCRLLAEHYKTVFVPEMARWVLGEKKCVAEDFPMIAYAQFAEVERLTLYANKILICDTDLLVTKVYEMHYFDRVHQEVLDLQKLEHYDLYLVCDTDIPWVADEQRDLGHLREEMKAKFVFELEQKNIPYHWIRGSYEERFQTAVEIIDCSSDFSSYEPKH
jgi:HTH-type transcriptional regulator, transcriptional repressor of NAD biosynthesis genes